MLISLQKHASGLYPKYVLIQNHLHHVKGKEILNPYYGEWIIISYPEIAEVKYLRIKHSIN